MSFKKSFLLVAMMIGPVFVSAQEESVSGIISGFSLLGNPSVIGSDGFLYIVSGSTKSPRLEAYNLDSAVKTPVDTYKFSGYPTHLEIGKDNRLFLVVVQTSTTRTTSFLGLSSTKATLYIIPTPFPAKPAGATLETVAVEASELFTDESIPLSSVVQVELEGTVRSVKVKAVGAKEYLYIITNQFQFSPLKLSSKLHIYDSDGKKVKDVTLE